MGDGLEGRRLTGLLTVKRENFPGMREFGGRVRAAMLERWPGEEVRLGRWVLPGGVGVCRRAPCSEGWALEGVTSYRTHPPRRTPLSQPFLEQKRKPQASSLAPRPPCLFEPVLGGGGAGGGEIRQQRGTSW